MRIPVVFATDENYIFYTCVAITSLAVNAAPDSGYDIYILTGEKFNDESLLDKVKRKFANINVQVIKVNPEAFQNVVINNSHVTKATFYRLLLCDLLDADKCIYLDSDIIVTEDLQNLYSVDMEEYYIAGCRDIWIDLLTEEKRKERRKRTGIPSMDEYVNAGVLLLNLRKIKEDGIDKKFMEQLSVDYLFEDQDIINVCCYGKIRHLPAKWNIYTLFLGQIEEMRSKGVDEETLKEFQEKEGIIHYATPFIRPWECSLYRANDTWWAMAAYWKEEACYRKLFEKVCGHERQERWSYWLKKCAAYEKVVIFGFTAYGREVCEWLLRGNLKGKLVFCDNNPVKWEQMYKGIKVLPLKDINKDGALFINSSQRRNKEVMQELEAHGIREEDILCYLKDKPDGYYQYLDERYYLDELRDIFQRECGPDMGEFQEDLSVMKRLLKTDLQYWPWYDRYRMREWILKDK